ncbi:MAG TPA: hypothetical protein VNL71_22135, partial [Chloroflexota bacterium]|nr:hypothetical protein [Chloroflexota bacterium]
RRDGRGVWLPWPGGKSGELPSAVLGLTLVAAGFLLRFRDEAAGVLIPLLEELDAELAVAEAGREQAEAWATEMEAARNLAEAGRATAEARARSLEAELAWLRRQE